MIPSLASVVETQYQRDRPRRHGPGRAGPAGAAPAAASGCARYPPPPDHRYPAEPSTCRQDCGQRRRQAGDSPTAGPAGLRGSMTIDAASGRTGDAQDTGAPCGRVRRSLPSSSSSVRPTGIFNCPVCSRPLAVGATRSRAAEPRLILSTPARRVAIFTLAGVLLGLVLSWSVAAGLDATQALLQAAGPGASPIVQASSGILPSAVPTGPVVPAIPPIARSALGQTAVLNNRLDEGALALRAPERSGSRQCRGRRYPPIAGSRRFVRRGSGSAARDLGPGHRRCRRAPPARPPRAQPSLPSHGRPTEPWRGLLFFWAAGALVGGRTLAAIVGVTMPPSTVGGPAKP